MLKAFDIKGRAMAFEVYLDNIPLPRGGAGKSKKKLELSPFQSVDKDLAFVVSKNVPAASRLPRRKTPIRNILPTSASLTSTKAPTFRKAKSRLLSA